MSFDLVSGTGMFHLKTYYNEKSYYRPPSHTHIHTHTHTYIYIYIKVSAGAQYY